MDDARPGLAPRTRAVAALAVFAAYVVAGKVGLALANVNPSASAVWAPTGIAIAAILLGGPRLGFAVFAGAFVVNVTTAGTVATSFVIALGNAGEGLAGAWLVERFAGGRYAFDKVANIFRFGVLAALVAPIVSAAVGTATLVTAGLAPMTSALPVMLTWWLGDAAGAIIVAPLILTWASPGPRLARRDRIEITLVLIAFAFLAGLVFGAIRSPGVGGVFIFILLPVIAAVAFRYPLRVTATFLAVLAMVAVWGTAQGRGPFIGQTVDELTLLTAYMGVVALTGHALGGALRERREAEDALRRARDELEDRVTARTSELGQANQRLRAEMAERGRAEAGRETLAAIVRTSGDAIISATPSGNILTWNAAAERLFMRSFADAVGTSIEELSAGGADILTPARIGALNDTDMLPPFEMRLRAADGTNLTASVALSALRDDRGDIDAFSFVIRDTSARRAAEEAERKQVVTRKLARKLLEHMAQDRWATNHVRRELGRALAREAASGAVGGDIEVYLEAFRGMGLGELELEASGRGMFTFVGRGILDMDPESRTPSCMLGLGYAEGIVASVTGEALGSETECQCQGHAACRFIVRGQPEKARATSDEPPAGEPSA